MTQDEALAILKTGKSVLLTGEPGSGKTHTAGRYAAYLRAHGVPVAITASTGIAATHLGGRTVHSWSGIGVRESFTPEALDRLAENKRIAGRVRSARVLIVDEISMLGASTFTLLEVACRHLRGNAEPFGGLQVVLVGDFFQMPPVRRASDDIAPDASFAFASPAWQALAPAVLYLTEQHRQDDPTFLGLLSAIRSNALEDRHRALLTAQQIAWDDAPAKCTRLFPHNRSVDRINDEELGKLDGPARVLEMRRVGPEPLVQALEAGCLSPARLALKPGAVVMFTKNDPQGRYVNGTLGTVAGFDEDEDHPIVLMRSGKRLTVAPAEWTAGDGDAARAKLIQTPLRLAWAITVHKSQGMSLDAAVIDLSGAFEYGHGYVALSRVRSLAGLHLLGWSERALAVHPVALAEDARFRARSERARAHLATLDPAALADRHAAFVAACNDTAKGGGPVGRLDAVRQAHANAYRPWSPAEEQDLRRRHAGGETADAIALSLGRKPGAIRSRLKKLGMA